MRLEIRTENKQFQAVGKPKPRTDAAGNQRVDKTTGALQWQVNVLAMDGDDDGEVIRVTVAGNPPEVAPGQPVQVVGLIAFPWEQNGRSGVAYRAESITPIKSRTAAA